MAGFFDPVASGASAKVFIVVEMVFVKFVVDTIPMSTWTRVYYNNTLRPGEHRGERDWQKTGLDLNDGPCLKGAKKDTKPCQKGGGGVFERQSQVHPHGAGLVSAYRLRRLRAGLAKELALWGLVGRVYIFGPLVLCVAQFSLHFYSFGHQQRVIKPPLAFSQQKVPLVFPAPGGMGGGSRCDGGAFLRGGLLDGRAATLNP